MAVVATAVKQDKIANVFLLNWSKIPPLPDIAMACPA
jgi:hypothetical protein